MEVWDVSEGKKKEWERGTYIWLERVGEGGGLEVAEERAEVRHGRAGDWRDSVAGYAVARIACEVTAVLDPGVEGATYSGSCRFGRLLHANPSLRLAAGALVIPARHR